MGNWVLKWEEIVSHLLAKWEKWLNGCSYQYEIEEKMSTIRDGSFYPLSINKGEYIC